MSDSDVSTPSSPVKSTHNSPLKQDFEERCKEVSEPEVAFWFISFTPLKKLSASGPEHRRGELGSGSAPRPWRFPEILLEAPNQLVLDSVSRYGPIRSICDR